MSKKENKRVHVSMNKYNDYIIGIYNVKKRGHLHNMIYKTLWCIVKSRKMVNPWRSWNKHINLACCSSNNGNFLNLFFSVDIFNINYNVIRISTPYLYYKFIVKCYKSLESKKRFKLIVLELYNTCIVLDLYNKCIVQ